MQRPEMVVEAATEVGLGLGAVAAVALAALERAASRGAQGLGEAAAAMALERVAAAALAPLERAAARGGWVVAVAGAGGGAAALGASTRVPAWEAAGVVGCCLVAGEVIRQRVRAWEGTAGAVGRCLVAKVGGEAWAEA